MLLGENSKIIETFLNYIDEAKSCYEYSTGEMSRQDQLTQDLLHSLELDELTQNQRNSLTTKLKTNRKDRRYFKDRVEELTPIIEYLNQPGNKQAIDKLKQVLGQVRKQESYHKGRTYIPKVLREELKQQKKKG